MPICLPSGEQMDWPAVEHVPVDAPVDDVDGVVEPDEELVIADDPELGCATATGDAATGEAAAMGEAASAGAAAGAPEAATEGAAEAAPLEPDDAGLDDPDPDDPDDAAPDDPAPDEADPDPDPDEDDPAADVLEFDPDDPDDPHLAPVGGVSALVPNLSTDVPGSGNCTSAESTVSQSVVGMLALNMAGKDTVALFFDPPLTLIDAQFMYISRLPILLNHVQAKVYDPGVIPSGME